jgi:hypothetical protein
MARARISEFESSQPSHAVAFPRWRGERRGHRPQPWTSCRKAGSISGVGKGYRYNEFMGFAMPLEEADARFEEALAIITKHGLQSNASLTTAASGRSS